MLKKLYALSLLKKVLAGGCELPLYLSLEVEFEGGIRSRLSIDAN